VKSTLGPIVQLGVEKDGLYTVGGSGKNCSARYVGYSSTGDITGRTDNPAGVWFLNPKDRDQVQGPQRAQAAACEQEHLVSLAALDTSRAVVICSKGSMMATFNSADSWKKVGKAPGTLAIAAGSDRYWTARSSKDCIGLSIQSFVIQPNGVSGGPGRCVAVSEITAGEVAISVDGDAIWLWAGKTVTVSTNNGNSWS
jgi:hypothetical protein